VIAKEASIYWDVLNLSTSYFEPPASTTFDFGPLVLLWKEVTKREVHLLYLKHYALAYTLRII